MLLAGRRLRQRGPMPMLAESEVLTIEVVGEFLRMDQDTALFAHFHRYHADLFPGLAILHRPTFVRQAANLWQVKERIWGQVLARKCTASCPIVCTSTPSITTPVTPSAITPFWALVTVIPPIVK